MTRPWCQQFPRIKISRSADPNRRRQVFSDSKWRFILRFIAVFKIAKRDQEGYRFWMILSKSVQQKATCASKASHFCRAKAVAHPTDLGLGVGQTKSPMKARSIEEASGNLSWRISRIESVSSKMMEFTTSRTRGLVEHPLDPWHCAPGTTTMLEQVRTWRKRMTRVFLALLIMLLLFIWRRSLINTLYCSHV